MILPDAHGGGILKEKDHVRSQAVLEAIPLSKFQDLNEGKIKKSSEVKVDKTCLLRGAEKPCLIHRKPWSLVCGRTGFRVTTLAPPGRDPSG